MTIAPGSAKIGLACRATFYSAFCHVYILQAPSNDLNRVTSRNRDETMLRSASPYSSFFTSGLLFEGFSTTHPFAENLAPRRGSLPNDMPPSLCGTSQKIQSPSDVSSAFYFTLQPRRDTIALRSFLSLDLAESQSSRSASLHRNDSTVTKSITSPRKPMPLHHAM